METKNLVGMILAVTVSLIVAGVVLVPSVDAMRVTAGDETTLYNNGAVVLREAESGDVLLAESVYDSDSSATSTTWYLNDEVVTNPTGGIVSWNVGLLSDGLYLQIYNSSNSAMGIYYDMSASTPTANYIGAASSTYTERSFSITFGDSEITVTITASGTSSTYTFDYTWAYVMCPYADGEYCTALAGGVGYVSEADDVILCGAYTSGDFDTMYYYKDGETYVSNSAYTMTVDIDTEITEGTTDIYTATVSVDMTDGTDTETFTPYRILVPYAVDGHATSGAVYDVLGVLSVVVILAILMVAVRFVTQRD